MKQNSPKKQSKKQKKTGDEPGRFNNPEKGAISWAFFDSQLNKYRTSGVSQRLNPIKSFGVWLWGIPRFVINWFKVYEPRWRTALALLILVAIVSSVFFINSSLGQAASITFVQTDWSGGASATTAAHPGDQSAWNKFSAQTNADTATGGSVKTSAYTTGFSETFNTTTYKDAANTTAIWDTSGQLSNSTIAFRSESHVSGTGTSPTVTEPSGTVQNDILVGLIYVNKSSATLTAPVGWTVLYSGVSPSIGGSGFHYNLAYIVRGATAPNLTWTISGSTGRTVTVIAFSGVNINNPIDSQSASGATGTLSLTNHPPDPPATTAVATGAMAVTGGVHWTGSTAPWIAPTNYTVRSYNPGDSQSGEILASRLLTSAGSENPSAFADGTDSTARDYWDGFTITLNPAAVTTTAQSLTVDATTDNIRAGTLTKNDTPGTGSITYYLANNGSTFNQVTPGSEFAFSLGASDLRFKIVLTGNATVQDINISYTGYYATADLTSSAYNTSSASNLITKLAWTPTVPAGQTVKFQIRSAPDSAGSPGTWSAWCGYSDCSGSTYFDTGDNNVTLGGSHALRTGGNDQWFQYKILFTSNGLDTAIISDLTLSYVVNAPPQFDADYPTPAAGGVSASQITNSGSADFGKVTINYRIRDTDTTSGTVTPGFVTPSFEYNIGGGWIAITSGYLGAADLNNKAVDTSNYTTFTATWNAQAQIANNYTASAQVRVTINDNEAANSTVQATTANFTVDTKVPVISAFTVNSATDVITLTATDDTNLEYRLSNNSDLTADGVNGTSGAWQSAGGNSISINPSWTFTGSPNEESVYVQVRDTGGNTSSATAVAPATPHDMDIKDISNADAASFKLFISWSVYTPVANAAYSKYEIYRSTDGSSYSLVGTITDVNINYYADFTTAQGVLYYYKVRIVDTGTDIGNYSAVVSDTPNGTQPGDVAPPVISAVTVADIQPTSATITWTTDELSDSRIDYSISPSATFDTGGQSNVSVVTSHSLTLTHLNTNTTYLFEVRSTDIFGNRTTDDNSQAGYSFTTGSGPVLSGVTETAVSDHTATIFWTSDVNSDSFVSYSTNPGLTSPVKVGSATLVGGSNPYQHSVDLANLDSGETYYYFVESKDAGQNNTQNTNGGTYYSFVTTTDNIPPVISGISTPVIAPTAGVVVWQTDELATTQLSWGTTSGNLTTTTTLDSTLTIFHVVSISALAEDTEFFYKVMSKDGGANETISNEGSFTTGLTTIIQVVSGGSSGSGNNNPPPVVLDTTPPEITGIKTENISSFRSTISFDTDEDAVGFIQYGKEIGNYEFTAGGSEYAESQSVNLAGLQMGTEYNYRVRAVDKSGNVQTSDAGTFKTQFFTQSTVNIEDAAQFQKEIEDAIASALPSLVAPFIEKPQATEITASSAKITWRTNVKAYSIVGYASDDEFSAAGADKPYATEVSDTTNKVNDHELILQNLNPNTRYHFRVKAFSLPQVVGQSNDLTFVTKALNIQAQISAIGNSSFRVGWRTNDPTSSVVEFRNTTTGVLNQKAIDERATSHEILVDGLTPATTYEVSVFGINSKGNRVQTATAVRITTSKDTGPPQITSLTIDTAIIPGRTDRAQTIVSWKTNEPSTSTVFYEEGAGSSIDQETLANKIEITNSFVLDHAVVLSVLKPGGLYRIQVASTDTAGNTSILPVRTIVIPRQSESILDVVFKNFEDTFKFLRQIGK